MGVTSDQAAQLLDIAGGALRSIELSIKPASLALAYRAARLFRCDVSDLLAEDEGTPDEGPTKDQEKETNTGPGRKAREKDPNRGPKRAKGMAA